MAVQYQVSDGTYRAPALGLTAKSATLFLLWVALASSCIVMIEPAPFDIIMAALVLLLPLVGAASLNRRLAIFVMLWLVVGAGGLVASAQAGVLSVPVLHTVVSIFLSFASATIAATVCNEPSRGGRLVMPGLAFAMAIAALVGIAGYFDAFPGAYDSFTKFDRAKAAFKDPNVYGAFLVPAIVYSFHCMATARSGRALVHTGLAGLVCVGLLVSFSRGAWFNAVLSLATYVLVALAVSQTNRLRLRLFLISFFGISAALLGLAAILQVDAVAGIFSERAALALGYDSGPQGRFSGQLKALQLVTEHPFGLGALEFSRSYHHEDVHNVYLSMFLNSGWLGGFAYITLVVATLGTALSQSLRSGPQQGLMIVMLASFTGLAVEGVIIDTDHWRHFYVLMGMIWGLAAANDRLGRAALARGLQTLASRPVRS